MSMARRAMGVALPLVLVLAACGTNDEGGQTSAPAEGPAGGELTVWAMGAEGEALGVLAEEFMADNPDVTVNVTPIAWDVAHDRLITAIAGNQTPDVTQLGSTWAGEFAETGALDPVPENFDAGAFFEGIWDTNVVDDTAYGVPWYVETRLLYYRTDLAEAAGITEPPADWDELKQMARALQEGGAPQGIQLTTGTGSWQVLLPFVWSNGGQVASEDGTFALDSPEVVEAIEYYDSFFEEGLAEPQPEGFDVTPAFVQGTVPMFFSGPWHMALIEEAGGAEFEGKWAIAPMPQRESGTSFVGGSNLAVFADSDNRDTAWQFVEFLTQPEIQARWFAEVGALPAVQDAWEDEALSSDERLSVFGQQLQDAQSPPSIPTWEEVASAIDDQLEQVTVGDTAPEQAAQDMQAAAEAIGTGR
jgi:multiple sugar transport system substrate-binding protein